VSHSTGARRRKRRARARVGESEGRSPRIRLRLTEFGVCCQPFAVTFAPRSAWRCGGDGARGIGRSGSLLRLGLSLAPLRRARAHLVVARRVFDSLTPGWQQVGAVWLPLPHLLNALPVQIDWLYRTGFSAIAISIASMALGRVGDRRAHFIAPRGR